MSILIYGRTLTRVPYLAFRGYSPIPRQRWESTLTHKPRSDNTLQPAGALDNGVNPPLTSLPPPFESPQRDANHGTARHLIKVGKAYLGFYKEGVKRVWGNRKVLGAKIETLPPDDRPSIFRPSQVPRAFTRGDWVFFWRVRHDVSRLPLFALILLVFDELTVLIAYYIDGVMPYTCRLPKQVLKTRARAQDRLQDARQHIEWKYPKGATTVSAAVARNHALQGLHLISILWDKIGFVLPGLWALKGRPRIEYLEADDRLLRQYDIKHLSREELIAACTERGISVLDNEGTERQYRPVAEMLESLQKWLDLTFAVDAAERQQRMFVLLLTKREKWPDSPKLKLPDWTP